MNVRLPLLVRRGGVVLLDPEEAHEPEQRHEDEPLEPVECEHRGVLAGELGQVSVGDALR